MANLKKVETQLIKSGKQSIGILWQNIICSIWISNIIMYPFISAFIFKKLDGGIKDPLIYVCPSLNQSTRLWLSREHHNMDQRKDKLEPQTLTMFDQAYKAICSDNLLISLINIEVTREGNTCWWEILNVETFL